ncbi:DUF488 domain-containing protein [Candidatus Bathyarchaeota archaeon]|nr:DUF488 domain-containing protein [Candidatus Bathyarchaeota archaeon]
MKIAYTIGYASREISEFIKILKEHNVTIIVDVRRFPKSKNPMFGKEMLSTFLRKHGIKYVFLGESLGGFVKGGYERYMKTQKFRDGFKVLLDLIEKETVILMCREKKAKHCHRRFIANLLEKLGVKVIHL